MLLPMRHLGCKLRPARVGREMVRQRRQMANAKGSKGRRLAREMGVVGKAEANEAFSR